MQWFIANRQMRIVSAISNESDSGLWIDDSTGGQKIENVSGCFLGTYEFIIDASMPGIRYIQPGNYILFKDKYDKKRMYTIMSIDGDSDLSVKCEEAGLDLLNIVSGRLDEISSEHNYTENPLTIDTLMNIVLDNSGWNYRIHNTDLSKIDFTKEKRVNDFTTDDTLLKRLEDICQLYSCEMDFEISFDQNYIVDRIVNVYPHIETNPGIVSRRYLNDFDLVSLSVNKNISSLFTAIFPRGSDDITISEMEYDDGRFKTVKNSPVLYDTLMNKQWSRYSHIKNASPEAGYITCIYQSSKKTPEELFSEALSKLKLNSQMQFSYDVKTIDVNGAGIGDIVQIVDTSKDDNVFLQGRINSITHRYSTDDNDECTISNYQSLKPNQAPTIQKIINEVSKNIVTKVSSPG